jgi:hypothetical protein
VRGKEPGARMASRVGQLRTTEASLAVAALLLASAIGTLTVVAPLATLAVIGLLAASGS